MFVHALRQSPSAKQSLVVTAGSSLTAILGNAESSQGKSRLTGLTAMVEGAPLVMEMLCMGSHSVHTRSIKMCTKRRFACCQFILRDVFTFGAVPRPMIATSSVCRSNALLTGDGSESTIPVHFWRCVFKTA